ncbi:MAG: aminotransferase class V-fold PLP-dependent enzyme, partial [Acidobacteria bacterium]|nr:aminotransferase class V-fold PLP-dependent enzyme [Acidobacteriota bacterium]
EEFWKAVRGCFALDPAIVYLNNGSLGPTPLPVLRGLVANDREIASNPTEKMWGPVGNRLEEVRGKAAALLGVSPDDVALTRNTTEGISNVGMGLGLVAGDEVITTDQEHPGGSGVWQFLETRGVRRIAIPVPIPPAPWDSFLEKLSAALTPKTKVLALPHLTFGTGHLLPLREAAAQAKQRAVPLCVDGAHPPGMMPVDLKTLGCATYASSSHKWLLSPPGTGTLFVAPEFRERIAPQIFTGTGFTGKTARRYDDFGTRDVAQVLAQGEALDFHRLVGTERVWRRIQFLSSHLRSGLQSIPRVRILTPVEPGRSAGLTSFNLEGIPHTKALELIVNKAHFVLRAVPELDAIRVSTGIYNNLSELDLLLSAIKDVTGQA